MALNQRDLHWRSTAVNDSLGNLEEVLPYDAYKDVKIKIKEDKDLSVKAKSRFSRSLRSLSEPMSLAEMARTWDVCARAVHLHFT
ncbi:hypothetical protein RJ641_033939 [Dillenia turbinata]|uniref:Uncharacterized protein n=1 Tax=Dillenia turbinata TaxID=194707 RepID=A0AAN8VN87_9MAGN